MRRSIPFLITAGIFLFVGILTLKDYGINWDEPGHMMRGQIYAQFFLTEKTAVGQSSRMSPVLIVPGTYATRYYSNALETDMLTKPVSLPRRPLPQTEYLQSQKQGNIASYYEHDAWGWDYLMKYDGGHPPFADILSAFSNRFFFQFLHIVGDIESYHIVYLLLSSIGVFVIGKFAFDITKSRLIGVMVGISLALFPIFFADSHFNMKDPIQASFFAGAVWAWWRHMIDKRKNWFIMFVFFVCLAMGVKWNIIILPVIVLIWYIPLFKDREFRKRFPLRHILILALVTFITVVGFLFLIWPVLWFHPDRIFSVISYYFNLSQGGSVRLQPEGFVGPFGFNRYPILLLLYQTPPILLVLGAIGIISIFFSKNKGGELKVGYLVLLWLILPIIRTILPDMWFYNGLRYFMEVLPPLVLLSAFGLSAIFKFIEKKFHSGTIILKWVLCVIIFISLAVPNIRLHPYQNTYFNSLAGGLKGAQAKNLVSWMLTYGAPYKQAVEWLNAHAEKDADVALINGNMYSISPLWLRPDISISPYHFSGFEVKGEYIMTLYNPLDTPTFAARYPRRFLTPVHVIQSPGGAPILYIYKNDQAHYIHKSYTEQLRSLLFNKHLVSSEIGNYWSFDLGDKYLITRLTFKPLNPLCIESGPPLLGFYENASSGTDISLHDLQEQASNVFFFQELDTTKKGLYEFLIPAESARYVSVLPLENTSCLTSGNLISFSYVKNK